MSLVPDDYSSYQPKSLAASPEILASFSIAPSICALLTNEAYIGMLVWGKHSHNSPIRVENAWPAIVDRVIFNRVQFNLKARGPKIIHPRRTVSDYLLSGIIKCATCGKAMSGHSAKSGQFFYYRCANALKGGAAECLSHWIPKSKIEGFVIEKINSFCQIKITYGIRHFFLEVVGGTVR